MFAELYNICVAYLAQSLIRMSCRDSKPASPLSSKEFKEKVLKRGLELHNWAAVCREFGVPRKTLFRWRHKYANLLQQLASEMSVNVHYNPPVENQTGKSVSCITLCVSHTIFGPAHILEFYDSMILFDICSYLTKFKYS